ncbi:hypothetical protein [Paenibacillus lignilyticus]|uniref:Uncharacterized protein n=1 Tax=Paenibacillus lignilyticus TaxID=1172615 RepID=A0ABS5CH77_9BACL|nr:hypothetical protein [Paenibacillus lignilyticus]MBP3965233.1 hypothetical protein [Paenibacillus lignilyticus]
MVGSWRWNVFLGVGGSLLTLLFSLDSNGMAVTSLRCLYAFLTFFVLGFVFRALVALIMNPRAQALSQLDGDESKGSSVDFATPDQSDELNNLLKNQMDGSLQPDSNQGAIFQPLTPPKLVSTQNREPEELAKAIRHLTGG